MNMPISLMVRYCARAVRCRRQSGENKLETFVSIHSKVGEGLKEVISSMYFYSWGEYEADSQVYAIVAQHLYEAGVGLEDIAGLLVMNASEAYEASFEKT
jgi:hypothetical protein